MDPRNLIRFLQGRRLDGALAVVALLLALLPATWLMPWTGDLARLLSAPLAPVTHAGVYLRDRVRPPRESFDPRSPEALALGKEIARYQSLYEQARLELEQSQRSLEALRAVRARVGSAGGAESQLIEASVIATDASRPLGVLLLNAGERHGVRGGSAALVGSDLFAGVIAKDVGRFSSSLIPSARLSSIGVRLYPAEGSDPRVAVAAYPGAVLKPTGTGTFTAAVATTMPLAPGMIARLADDRYGRAALGSRVGVVLSVEPVDEAPNARRIVVQPVVDFGELASVIIVSDGAAAAAEGEPR
jgi:hypothetical protein